MRLDPNFTVQTGFDEEDFTTARHASRKSNIVRPGRIFIQGFSDGFLEFRFALGRKVHFCFARIVHHVPGEQKGPRIRRRSGGMHRFGRLWLVFFILFADAAQFIFDDIDPGGGKLGPNLEQAEGFQLAH